MRPAVFQELVSRRGSGFAVYRNRIDDGLENPKSGFAGVGVFDSCHVVHIRAAAHILAIVPKPGGDLLARKPEVFYVRHISALYFLGSRL